MRRLILIVICSAPLIAICQNKALKVSKDSVINKWVKAVVNIDCRRQGYNIEVASNLWNQLINGQISSERYKEITDSANNWLTSESGTAIFVIYKNRYYLITARHVIEDGLLSGNAFYLLIIRQNGTSSLNTGIPADDFKTVGFPVLMNLSAGTQNSRPYVFSNDDLALIDLNAAGQGFTKKLINLGYCPIKYEDIDTVSNLKESQNIMAIGFPKESDMGTKPLPVSEVFWQSNVLSLPMVSTGRIRLFKGSSNTFDCDIFVYHGFSGGPIVGNNKLLGIVHGFDSTHMVIPKEVIKPLSIYYAYHNVFIKSYLLTPMFKTLYARFNK